MTTRRDIVEFFLLAALFVGAIAFIAWNRNAYQDNFLKTLEDPAPRSPSAQATDRHPDSFFK